MKSDLNQKSVMVTGAASGIGKAIAQEFAASGAKVTIADKDKEKGLQTYEILNRLGADILFIPMDLGVPSQVEAAVIQSVEAFGRLDVLVNNAAAVGRVAPVLNLEFQEYMSLIQSNLIGTFQLSQLAAKQMVAQNSGGAIINILTIQTSSPVPGHCAYVASKGGLDALTLSLAVDLAGFGIRVNGIEVGSVYTESFRNALPDKFKGNEAESEELEVPPKLDKEAATLLGRMGRPADIAKVAAFLASDEASYLTGSLIRADGGRAISRKTEPLL